MTDGNIHTRTAQPIEKLVVIGVGLIGGSFALDLKRAGLVKKVVGVGRSRENLERALQLKVVDEATTHAAEAVREADLVLISTPVGQMPSVLREIAPVLSRHAIVTDAGSTKRDVVALYREYLADSLYRCIPAHPIAGSDLSGASAARYSLYEQRNVVLCQLPETDADVYARIASLWAACGANIVSLDANQHDAIFAAVSHLPHLLAFTYMNNVLNRGDAELCLQLAATGFRDFTRIAGSSPEMWRDIAVANRDGLLSDLKAFRHELDVLIDQLDASDRQALTDYFGRASEVRARWGKR